MKVLLRHAAVLALSASLFAQDPPKPVAPPAPGQSGTQAAANANEAPLPTPSANACAGSKRSQCSGPCVIPGLLIHKVQPVYPPEAKAKGVQGTVVLHVHIDKDGRVDTATVVSGPQELRQATLDAAKKWRGRPYRQGELPKVREADEATTFTLTNQPSDKP